MKILKKEKNKDTIKCVKFQPNPTIFKSPACPKVLSGQTDRQTDILNDRLTDILTDRQIFSDSSSTEVEN